jgi:ATP-dependent RNA helicase DHX29
MEETFEWVRLFATSVTCLVYHSARFIYTAVRRSAGTKVSVLETRILGSQWVHCLDTLDSGSRPARMPRPGYTFTSVPTTPSVSTSLSAFNLTDSGANGDPSTPDRSESAEQDSLFVDESSPQSLGAHTRTTSEHVSLENSPSISDDEGEGFDLDGEADPNVIYGMLRVQLLGIQRSGLAKKREKRLSALKRQIESVKSDYMFSSRLAEAEFASKLAKMEADALQTRLKKGGGPGQLPAVESISNKRNKKRPGNMGTPAVSSPSIASIQLKAEAEEEEEGTMFGNLLEEMPTEEIGSTGTVISVRDMALPKHWSGKTPKLLLNEVVTNMDRYATVHYTVVSGGSRAVRCRCTVRWAGGRAEEWTMDAMACHNSDQAEHYIATVALHDIAFPLSAGFAGGSTTSCLTPNYRVLPPKFRDLWDELEVSRKLEQDSINRSVWSELKVLLDTKLASREVICFHSCQQS